VTTLHYREAVDIWSLDRHEFDRQRDTAFKAVYICVGMASLVPAIWRFLFPGEANFGGLV
jgi:hypothetical protein